MLRPSERLKQRRSDEVQETPEGVVVTRAPFEEVDEAPELEDCEPPTGTEVDIEMTGLVAPDEPEGEDGPTDEETVVEEPPRVSERLRQTRSFEAQVTLDGGPVLV